MERSAHAKTLRKIATNDEIKWLQEGKQGMLVECILALGHLYQMGNYKELEGIMDLVIYLENKTRYGEDEKEEMEPENDQKGVRSVVG
eukprot:16445565-Heterocapsa_arctica.AAC.1